MFLCLEDKHLAVTLRVNVLIEATRPVTFEKSGKFFNAEAFEINENPANNNNKKIPIFNTFGLKHRQTLSYPRQAELHKRANHMI
jgi:hypothetical protein